MTGEEMERAIEFLLQSQAKNDAQIGLVADQVGDLTHRVDELTRQVTETHRLMQLHAETQTEFIQVVTRSLDALTNVIARVNAKVDATDARVSARADATDARLDRLAATVERIITGRGDQPPAL